MKIKLQISFIVCLAGILVNCTKCGKILNKDLRIVGGTTVEHSSNPWFVVLGHDVTYFIDLRCGGSLITSLHVLTAAHCLQDNDYEYDELYVFTGVNNLRDPYKTRHKIKSMKIHPKFTMDTLIHDIGIVQLRKRSSFMPICLPNRKDILYKRSEVIGYGTINPYTTQLPSRLQHAFYKAISKEMCKKFVNFDLATLICGIALKPNTGSCNGDSGGPFQSYNESNIATIFGIVSFRVWDCGDFGNPTFYSDVRTSLPWIRKNIK